MTETNRDSVLYDSVYVKKYLSDSRDKNGRAVPIPFFHTVVSGEDNDDSVNLCVLPANCMVVGLEISSNNVWASAGVNGTLILGDVDDTDRYMIATELYTAAGSPLGSDFKHHGLAFAGQNYRPTTDTIVKGTYAGTAPTVGKIYKGVFWVVPGN